MISVTPVTAPLSFTLFTATTRRVFPWIPLRMSRLQVHDVLSVIESSQNA